MLAGMAEKAEPPAFVPARIPLSPEETAQWQKLDLDALGRFFSNPARFFIQRRLGFLLEEKSPLSEDRENFVLVALEKYLVEQNLFKARLSGSALEDFMPVQKALGQLPHGHVGDFHYNEMGIEAENFVSKIKYFTSLTPGKPIEIDLKIAGFDLKGRVSEIAESGFVNIRYARKRVADILTSWIHHLALCHGAPPQYPQPSVLICKDSAIQFGAVPESKDLLEDLLNLFRRGLEGPLHFFPEASWQYAEYKLNKAGSEQSALAKAGLKWRGPDSPQKYARAESDNPYYDLCFRRMDPLDDEFKKIALKVFTPLFAYSKEFIL